MQRIVVNNSDQPENHRIKILYVTSSPHLAGAERCLLTIVSHLDQNRFHPIVLVPGEGGLANDLRQNGIDVRIRDLAVLGNKREIYSPKFLIRLGSLFASAYRIAKLISAENIVVVHSNTSGILVGSFAALFAHVPHIWHIREILEEPKWVWAIMRRLIPLLSSRVICVSSGVRSHLQATPRNSSKLDIVHDAIDVDSLLEHGTKDSGHFANHDDFIVGMLARINPRKGQTVFLSAAKIVLDKYSGISFHLAGGCLPAYRDVRVKMEEYIVQHNLDEKVKLLGDLALEQVAALMKRLDILVMPSTSPEGFGLTLLEAMAFGKPVIASDAGGPRDIVIPGVTGFLVPPGDADALAQAILRLLNDPELRLSMGIAGHQRLLDHFSLKAHMHALESIYHDVLQ